MVNKEGKRSMGARTIDNAEWLIRPASPAVTPEPPEDESLTAVAVEARASVARMEEAVLSGEPELIICAKRTQVELAMALEKAADTDYVRREVWLDGYSAAESACPVPLPGKRRLTVIDGGSEAAGAPPAPRYNGRHRRDTGTD